MIQKTKRKTLLLFGLLTTGLVGIVAQYFHVNFSKDDSLLCETAYADGSSYVDLGGASGCGGCSAAGGGPSY